MTTEAQPGTVIEAIVVTKDMLREAITQYIVESRTGGTLSYQTTAMMPADDVANSNAEHLWGLLSTAAAQDSLQLDDPGNEAAPLIGSKFIAAERIEPGQIVTFNESGELIGYVEPPVVIGEDVNTSVLDANPAVESGFFDSV